MPNDCNLQWAYQEYQVKNSVAAYLGSPMVGVLVKLVFLSVLYTRKQFAKMLLYFTDTQTQTNLSADLTLIVVRLAWREENVLLIYAAKSCHFREQKYL